MYVDYRGRGRSAPVADPSEVTFIGDVADIAALIRTLGLGAVNVYGFSYGGMVAQALALDHPELVKRLILANTLHSPEMWQKNHENINREIEMQYPEVWEQDEVAKLPDFRPRLKELRMPVLILAGRYDRALCPKYQWDFKRFAPQAEFVWMERSGTFSHIEEPEAVFTLVRRFLEA